MIGFAESAYIGEERGYTHSVLAGYLSGLPDNRVITYTSTSITASKKIIIAIIIIMHNQMRESQLFIICVTPRGDIKGTAHTLNWIPTHTIAKCFNQLKHCGGRTNRAGTAHIKALGLALNGRH